MTEKKRDSFQTKFGFIIACVGSAVGMGNIWMFPYRVAEHGGAAFLIPYIIFVVLIGTAGVAGEMAFGRAMQAGPLGAFGKATKTRGSNAGRWIGLIPTLGSLAMAIGYSVVVGWIIKYLIGSISGSALSGDTGAYFGALCGNFGSLPWHMIGLAICFLFMVFGISKGVERLNKVVMPIFFLLFVILAIRVATLEGSGAGYMYLIKPEWSQLANPKTWLYALGQAFFSLSLAGSGTLVFGSYLKKDEDVISCAKNVAFFDTTAAILAALVIIPAVFVFGLDLGAGPGLMFITMPMVFQMMPFGQVFMVIFFVAVFLAAITSLVNLFESPVEALQTQFGLPRGAAVAIVAAVGVVVGIMIENGDTVSTWMDVVSIYIVPVGALLAAIMFFWVCPKGFAMDQVQMGRKKKVKKFYYFLTKYVFVILTLVVIIAGIAVGGIG